jgi:hypothetical protein
MNSVATYSRPPLVEFEAALTALLQGAGDERGGILPSCSEAGRYGEMTPLHVHAQFAT